MIEVKNLSKLFRIPSERRDSLFESVKGLIRPVKYEDVWALRNINFEVKKGEFIGIIGENGAGKTTLLKIIANVLSPTEGYVKTTGRVIPFLELGLGFHDDFTGKENICLYSQIMGLNKKEIDKKIGDIVKFSGVKKFINAKLSAYSSGMKVRLAFSTAVQTDPDILLVDEVLAVGDFKFQQKCFDVFRRFKKNKKTVLFVSHDMGAIREFCDRVLLLKKGKQVIFDEPGYVINKYIPSIIKKNDDVNNPKTIKNDPIFAKEVKKLRALYIFPGDEGDIIMSTPVIRALKKKYSKYDIEIDFLTMNQYSDILIGNPNISRIYTDKHAIKFDDYFQIFGPHIKTQRIPDWQKTGMHIMDLYAELCGIKLKDYKTEIYPLKVNLEDYGLKENEAYVCLHTQGSLKCKDWPYFKDLIKKLKSEFKIVVIDEQQHNYPDTIQLPPKMKLREKAYIISKSKMLIGVDSIGIQMSCALNVPTIAIYGNTLPELCKPLANKNLITIEPKKRCTEGWHHICKKGKYCINNISVNEVLEKIEELKCKTL